MELIKITIAVTASDGGEGGIRTLGRGKPTHAFQACAFNRSATSPAKYTGQRPVAVVFFLSVRAPKG